MTTTVKQNGGMSSIFKLLDYLVIIHELTKYIWGAEKKGVDTVKHWHNCVVCGLMEHSNNLVR